MSIAVATVITGALGIYLACGVVFALAFVAVGAARIDPDARQMPLTARALILPGVAALWPLMLFKWLTQKAPPVS